MRKISTLAAVLAASFVGVVFAADTPDIETIMKKVNSKKGLHNKVGAGLKEASPNWADLGKQMDEYKTLADALGKNEPPKGDKKSWETLSKAYAADAAKLHDAVAQKDAKAAGEAHAALSKSCKKCHDAHK
jgi:cytochrome c556